MKVVYVSYPPSDTADVDVPASADNALGLRSWIESQGHTLVTTSDTGDELDRELSDTEVLITTPFWPVYLDEDRLKKAENLRLVVTAGIGSDHTDPETAKAHGVTVAEVTGSNVVSVVEPGVPHTHRRRGLCSGHLAGYAGDTWYPQPAPADHPWRSLPAGSEAMTIHCSGMTLEAQDRIAEGVQEMLAAHFEGEPVPDDFVVVDPAA